MIFRLLIFIFFFAFLLIKYGFLERQILDLTVLILSLFFLNFKTLSIFIILFCSSIILYLTNGNIYSFLNLSFLPIILIAYKPKNDFLNFNTILLITLYTFTITLIDLFTGNFVEGGDRISGPFTSSLHLSYFCVFFSYYISISKLKNKYLLGLLIFICALISGSRVAALGVLAMFFLNFNLKKIAYFLILFVPFIVFIAYKLELRSFSYIPEAEEVRFGGFSNFYNLINFEILFTGLGRFTYGATGYRFVGENAFITESSMIMILYSYGLFFGLFLIILVLYQFYILAKRNNNLYHFFVFFLLFIFSPLFDSTAVLFLNMLILSNLNVRKFSISSNSN
jgi:hypothetical protein